MDNFTRVFGKKWFSEKIFSGFFEIFRVFGEVFANFGGFYGVFLSPRGAHPPCVSQFDPFLLLSYHYHTTITPLSYHYHTTIIPLSWYYHTTIIPLSKLWNLHIFDSGLIVVFSAVCEWILPGDFAILWVSNAECGWDAGRSKRGDATDGSLAARTGENPKRTAARSEERRHTPQLRICISTVFAGAKNDDADANDVCLTANDVGFS